MTMRSQRRFTVKIRSKTKGRRPLWKRNHRSRVRSRPSYRATLYRPPGHPSAAGARRGVGGRGWGCLPPLQAFGMSTGSSSPDPLPPVHLAAVQQQSTIHKYRKTRRKSRKERPTGVAVTSVKASETSLCSQPHTRSESRQETGSGTKENTYSADVSTYKRAGATQRSSRCSLPPFPSPL